MEGLPPALNYESSHDLHFNNYAAAAAAAATAQQILENSKHNNIAEPSTPTITTLNALTSNEFLHKIGASILNSIQLKNQQQHQQLQLQQPHTQNSSELDEMDFGFSTNNRVILDSSQVDQLQQQLEYDKFMNEVWIGVVFTLILISMIFCICSCFLYHQFRTWKRNYHNNGSNSTSCTVIDIEALKLHPDREDPVPEYTLVSGLPSYEAALELLQKTPQSKCLIVYPSVFNVFNRQLELPSSSSSNTTATTSTITGDSTTPQNDEATSLLTTVTTTTQAPSTAAAPCESIKTNLVPSYEEIFGNYKIIDEKKTVDKVEDEKKDSSHSPSENNKK